MMRLLRHDEMRAAELRLVHEMDSAPDGVGDEDDLVMMAEQIDRLEEELLVLERRLQQLRTGLCASVQDGDRQPALAGV